VWFFGGHGKAHSEATGEGDLTRNARDPMVADLERLPYTDSVVKETLRLYAPIGRIGRLPIRDLDLDPPALRKDTAVFLSPFVTGRDPRWLSDAVATLAQHWRLRPSTPDRPRVRSLLTLKPRGAVWMIVQTA